jgi:hypothetical protein
VNFISSALFSLRDRKCLFVRQILEAVETVIIAGDDLDYGEAGSGDEEDEDEDGVGAGGEHQVLVVGDIHLKAALWNQNRRNRNFLSSGTGTVTC